MNKFQRFLTISKTDEDQRMVYGFATTPDLDSDGEIISLEAVKAALPEYLKFPTLREMHQPKAVGTVKEAEIKNGEAEGLWIGAKVVTEEAWKLVKEGVYKAFSIGGNVLRKAGNMITGLELVEISLVDVPANKAAVIELWKAGKLSKNAEMVYSLSNLMIQAKDLVSWLEHQDKKKEAKQMGKIMEQIKDLIAIEAAEAEPDKDDSMMLWARQVSDIEKRVSELSTLEFPDDKVGRLANAVRKGVIVSMNKKAEELKKKAEEAQAKLAEVLAKPVAERTEEDLKVLEENADHLTDEQKTQLESEKGSEEVKEEGDGGEKTEGDTVEENAEEKDAGVNPTMQKLNEINETLTKLAAKPEVKEESVDKTVSAETITKVTDTISKVAESIVALSEKVDRLEKSVANIPAAAKSKAAYVAKEITAADGGTKETAVVETDEVKTMKARLEELKKLRNELGPNEFSKRGLSREAADLLSRLGA